MTGCSHLVMITDVDPAVRDALQFALRLEGFEVRTHRGGAELLADADVARAGCVILDDGMPAMDGLELIRRLKARNITAPAILLTNHATDHLRAKACAAGVRLVLEKPLLDTALVDGILGILCGDEVRRAPAS